LFAKFTAKTIPGILFLLAQSVKSLVNEEWKRVKWIEEGGESLIKSWKWTDIEFLLPSYIFRPTLVLT
jgi:hypothetical protein